MEKKFDEENHDENFITMDESTENQESKPTINLQSQNGYGTFTRKSSSFLSRQKYLLCFANNSVICTVVILFGLIATITSTYFNLMNVINLPEFRSPCIQNISDSFDEL